MPYVSQSKLMSIAKDASHSPVDVNSVYGISLGYGLSKGLNLTGNVELTSFGSFSDFYSFRIGMKKAIRPDKDAISLCLGYYNSSFLRIGVNGYSNFYLTRKIYYCFDPAFNVLIYIGNPNYEPDICFSAFIFNNMTFEIGNHFFIRPEVSFDVFSVFQGVFWFNYGIACGLSF